MNRFATFALVLSLAGNAVLALVWIRHGRNAPANATDGSAMVATEPYSESDKSPAPAPLLGADPDKLPPWSELYSDDPVKLVANLRAAGLPPSLVRTIASTIIGEIFADRRRALGAGFDQTPYWKARTIEASRERSAKLRELNREQQEIMRQLFGTEAIPEEARAAQSRQFAFLPAAKRAVVERINTDYAELMSGIDFIGITQLPEDREKRALLEREKRADLVATLTSEELELFDLHTHPTANSLRYQLGMFNPSEDEFRALFALRRVFDDKYNTSAIGLSPDRVMAQQRSADQEALNEQIKSALGAERYAEYERTQNQGYRYAARIADHFKLPKENAIAAFELQKTYESQMNNLPQDRNQRTAAMQELARQATEELSALLTPAGVDAYKETAGSWLRSLERGIGGSPAMNSTTTRVIVGPDGNPTVIRSGP